MSSKEFTYEKLSPAIQSLLDELDCPGLLQRHLILVYNTASDLTQKMKLEFPAFNLLEDEIAFGAATHDIGKIIEKAELSEKGNRHEQMGYNILINYGIADNLARFTKTHGDWKNDQVKTEDLIVSLADKIWKGQRIDALEERLIAAISTAINEDYWTVYSKMDRIITEISAGADIRLDWQSRAGN